MNLRRRGGAHVTSSRCSQSGGLGLRVPHILMHNNKIDWSITKQYSSQCNILEAPEPA